MLIFEKIKWKNFLSTGNAFTEINIKAHDVTLIVGLNGSGKSTLLDSLSFGLFGKPFRKVNKTQLINSITKKACVVEVEFSIASLKYLVRRGMSPNIFEIFQDGILISQSANVRDYQDVFEKQILKFNHKSFCQVIALGLATFMPFMRLPAAQRRELIEDLLELEVFSAMNDTLKERIKDNNDVLFTHHNDKVILGQKIDFVKEYMTSLEVKRGIVKKELAEKRIAVQAEIEQIDGDIKDIAWTANKLIEEVADEKEKRGKLNKYKKLERQIEVNRTVIESDIEFLEKHENCPTCNQIIDALFKMDSIANKKTKLVEIEEGLEALQDRIWLVEDDLKNYDTIRETLSEFRTSVEVKKSQRQSLSEQVKDIQKQLNEEDQEDVINIEELAAFEKELVFLVTQIADIEEEKQLYSVAALLLKDNGIKSQIIKKYVPVINKYINKYLAEFELFCEFTLDENFQESIKSRNRDEFSYESFSQGERQRIDLSILFTWRAIAALRNTIHTNLLILDEVFDSSFDSPAIEYLTNIIRTFSKESNIIIISHSEQTKEHFDNVIRFEKKKNFSRIVKEVVA
jgi:DNA repair exonuclease SbcCD ATPase subunit